MNNHTGVRDNFMFIRKLKSCFILILFYFLTNAFAGIEGIDLFNQKKYDAAYRSLLPEFDAGQAAALFYIGRMYMEGLGSVPKDTTKGSQLIGRSAEKGFQPAIKFLIQIDKQSNNLKGALLRLEKLKAMGDQSVDDEIADINERLYGKAKDLNKPYCNAQSAQKDSGKKYNEGNFLTCLLDGKIDGKTTKDMVLVLKEMADSGDDEAALKALPYIAISQTDENWDPVSADKYIVKLMQGGKNLDRVKAALQKSQVSFESCRYALPGTSSKTQSFRASLCRIAAAKGDAKSVKFVADRELIGFDGFPRNLDRAKIFIDILPAGVAKLENDLYYLQLSGLRKQHQVFLLQNQDQDMNLSNLKEALIYQFDAISKNLKQAGQSIAPEIVSLDLIKPLVEIGFAKGDCEVRKKSNDLLTEMKRQFPPEDAGEIAYYDENIVKEECAKDNIAFPVRGNQSPKVDTSIQSKGNSTTISKTSEATSALPAKPVPGTSVPIVAKSFEQQLNTCDLKDVSACLDAANQILTGGVMKEITDKDAREKLALSILDKAVALDSIEAMVMEYDIFDAYKFPTPLAMQKITEFMTQFQKSTLDSARLRFYYNSLSTYDPLKSLFGTLSGSMSDYCNQVILIKSKGNLRPSDSRIVEKSLATIHCKR